MPGDYTYTKEYIRWFTADEEVRRDWFEPRLDGRPLFRHQQALGLEYKVLGLFPIDLGQLGKITSSHATMTGRDLLVGRINQQSRMVVGERIHPVPIPASWLRRVGSYDIIDVGQEETLLDRLRLTVQDGFLVLTGRFTKPTPFEFTHALEPLSDTEAIVMGLGLGDGVTLKVIPRAGEEIVRYSRVYDETNVAGLNAVNGSQRLEVSSPNRAVGTSRA